MEQKVYPRVNGAKRTAIYYTRVNANTAKSAKWKVIVPVMDKFRCYAHARVIADLTNVADCHEERTLKAS